MFFRKKPIWLTIFWILLNLILLALAFISGVIFQICVCNKYGGFNCDELWWFHQRKEHVIFWKINIKLKNLKQKFYLLVFIQIDFTVLVFTLFILNLLAWLTRDRTTVHMHHRPFKIFSFKVWLGPGWILAFKFALCRTVIHFQSFPIGTSKIFKQLSVNEQTQNKIQCLLVACHTIFDEMVIKKNAFGSLINYDSFANSRKIIKSKWKRIGK